MQRASLLFVPLAVLIASLLPSIEALLQGKDEVVCGKFMDTTVYIPQYQVDLSNPTIIYSIVRQQQARYNTEYLAACSSPVAVMKFDFNDTMLATHLMSFGFQQSDGTKQFVHLLPPFARIFIEDEEGDQHNFHPDVFIRDANECEDVLPGRSVPIGVEACAHSECVNTLGAFKCRCDDGYEATGDCHGLYNAARSTGYNSPERAELLNCYRSMCTPKTCLSDIDRAVEIRQDVLEDSFSTEFLGHTAFKAVQETLESEFIKHCWPDKQDSSKVVEAKVLGSPLQLGETLRRPLSFSTTHEGELMHDVRVNLRVEMKEKVFSPLAEGSGQVHGGRRVHYLKVNLYIKDMNECAERPVHGRDLTPPLCGQHATCVNTIGAYRCRCDRYSEMVDTCAEEINAALPTLFFSPAREDMQACLEHMCQRIDFCGADASVVVTVPQYEIVTSEERTRSAIVNVARDSLAQQYTRLCSGLSVVKWDSALTTAGLGAKGLAWEDATTTGSGLALIHIGDMGHLQAHDAKGNVHTSNPDIYIRDVDECTEVIPGEAEPRGQAVCGAHAECSNFPGAFTCACNSGYEKVRNCEDELETAMASPYDSRSRFEYESCLRDMCQPVSCLSDMSTDVILSQWLFQQDDAGSWNTLLTAAVEGFVERQAREVCGDEVASVSFQSASLSQRPQDMVLRWNYAYGDTFLAQLPALGTVTLLVEGRRTTYTPEFLVKNVNECEDTAPNAHHEPPIGQSVCGVNGQCVDTLGAFTCRCRDGITSQSNCKSLHDAAVQLPYGALERKELYRCLGTMCRDFPSLNNKLQTTVLFDQWDFNAQDIQGTENALYEKLENYFSAQYEAIIGVPPHRFEFKRMEGSNSLRFQDLAVRGFDYDTEFAGHPSAHLGKFMKVLMYDEFGNVQVVEPDLYVREVDECTEVEPGKTLPLGVEVCGNSTCHNTIGAFTCSCPRGFEPVGTCDREISDALATGYYSPQRKEMEDCLSGVCQDIDECAMDRHKCHTFANCINLQGSYTCECLPGFRDLQSVFDVKGGPQAGETSHRKPGRECEDIDECSELDVSGRVVHDCRGDAQCVNLKGTYKCECQNGGDCRSGGYGPSKATGSRSACPPCPTAVPERRQPPKPIEVVPKGCPAPVECPHVECPTPPPCPQQFCPTTPTAAPQPKKIETESEGGMFSWTIAFILGIALGSMFPWQLIKV